MVWWAVDLFLVFAGLVVLAVLAVRTWRRLRQLGRQVAGAAERLGEATARLEELADRLPRH